MQRAVVEDHATEAKRPLHKVIAGENLRFELFRRQHVQVELMGQIRRGELLANEVIVEVADLRPVPASLEPDG